MVALKDVSKWLQHGNGKFPDMGSNSKYYQISPLYKSQKFVRGILEHSVQPVIMAYSIQQQKNHTKSMVPASTNILYSIQFNFIYPLDHRICYQWKKSIIVPIYKKGEKTNCSIYRGTSKKSYKNFVQYYFGKIKPICIPRLNI